MIGKHLHLSKSVRRRIALSVAMGLASTVCYVLQGFLLALLLADLISGASDAEPMMWLLGFGAVILVRGLLLWVAEIAAEATAEATKEHLRYRLLTRLMELGPGVTLRRQTGDLQATIVGGVEALENYYSRYLPAIFIAVLGCGGVLAVIVFVDWPTALLLGLFVTGFPVLDRVWMRWRMPKTSGVFAAMGAFGTYLLDSLQGIVTLKAFGASAARRASLTARAAALRHESMATLAVTLMRTGLTGFVSLAGIALILAINAWRAADGDLAPFALLITLFLAREAFRPLERLEREFHTAWAASGAIAPIKELLAMEPPVRDPIRPTPAPAASDIQFDNVSFAYEGSDRSALSSVSFRVAAKEFVALVGSSGAGKSTIVALLLRFFDPVGGTIRIGGTDVRDLSLETLRSLINVVSQDPFLFHGTIEDNLKLAKPDATGEELRTAAKAAHIDTFIESLPQGYATEIGERGTQLSGGQRQRLTIARALLKDAPILILDEATANVDPASERAIQAALEELAGGRTTLVIAHRLSTVAKAARILVFDDGRLVEEGDHLSLEHGGGLYARLMAVQGEAA
ncbi:MAG: ABC transporter ATP-binding protein [Pseudolabrys sp.]